jgi:hypothetical protein
MKEIRKSMDENTIHLSAINSFNNTQNIEFFQKYPENIVNITDEIKLIEILSNPNCKPSNKDFIDFINEQFLDNIKILKLFLKKSTKLLDTKNIKNFDILSIK